MIFVFNIRSATYASPDSPLRWTEMIKMKEVTVDLQGLLQITNATGQKYLYP